MTTIAADTVPALLAEMRAVTDDLRTSEPPEVATIRTGSHHVRAGAGGQYFTTWDTAHGMLRDYACYTLFPLVKLAERSQSQLSGDHLLEVWEASGSKCSAYLGYSGFEQLHRFGERARTLAASSSRGDVVALLRELCRYANRLTAWSHHHFPWGVGAAMTYAESGTSAPATTQASPEVLHGIDGPRIRIAWEPLGVEVTAVLASSLNPELCTDVVRGLPFTVLQEHALVSGESMFAWAPLVSTAPVRHTERICDAPVGRLRYSQATGQKVIVQYGTTTEDLASAVLGQVVPEDCTALAAVGRAVWASTIGTSNEIRLTVRLA